MDENQQTRQAFHVKRQKDSQEDTGNEFFGLKNVPFFLRPMTAMPNDKVIGWGEDGRPVRKTLTGQEYTVKPAKDQRTTRTKVEEDILPEVQEWLDDPSVTLPSMGSVLSALKDIGIGAKESFEGAVSGTGTYGDVFGVAGMGAGASSLSKVPEGSLRIFGGSAATGFDEDNYYKAASLKEKGVDDYTVWEETGMQFNPDTRQWQFEIDSKDMSFTRDIGDIKKDARRTLDAEGQSISVPIERMVKFNTLFENYPRLKDIEIVIDPSLSAQGAYSSKENAIFFGANYFDKVSEEDIRSTLIHEIQHAVQDVEGTPGGNNQTSLIRFDPQQDKYIAADEVLRPYAKELNELDNKMMTLLDEFPLDDQQQKVFDELSDKHQELRTEAGKLAFKRYRADTGETEARAAALRDSLTSEEKKETPPSETKRNALNREMDKYKGAPKIGTPAYSKGGTVNTQGGFRDDGVEQEAHTGNEVPAGSLDQEVSDSVDAKLSEGEYVLPADVVRFIGLGKIEQMVDKAKKSLEEMEAKGRIGGEAVDENGVPTDELTPEEEEMLREALSADQGQTPEALGADSVGMAQGGAVSAMNAAQQGVSPFGAPEVKTPGETEEEGEEQPENPFFDTSTDKSGDSGIAPGAETPDMPTAEDMAAMSPEAFSEMVSNHNQATSVMGAFGVAPGIKGLMSAVDKGFKSRATQAMNMNSALATEANKSAISSKPSLGIKGAVNTAVDAAKSELSESAVGQALGLGKEDNSKSSPAEAPSNEADAGKGDSSGEGSEGGDSGDGSDGEGGEGYVRGGLVKRRKTSLGKKS